MRSPAYAIGALAAVWLVSLGSAITTVIGLALLFMAAFNIGWDCGRIAGHD